MNVPRIVLLIPYFGRWPFWMPFFLAAVRRNPDIDWLFFSDCGVPERLPPNVRIQEYSFAAYCELVSSRLGITFKPGSAYKLCDIKPALGYIHADDIQGFDFWGFSDIDLIYGDLRRYFTRERLARFDLLATHARRVSGHLCLMRNTAELRGLFMRVPSWRETFMDDAHSAFDEGAFSRIFIRHKNWPEVVRRIADRFNPWRRRSEFVEAFTTPNARIVWHDGKPGFPQRWIWQDGKLTNDRDGAREFPYFHFITWKSKVWPGMPVEQLMADPAAAALPAWSVSEQGFQSEVEGSMRSN
ncbi:DUF6625 family protein [Stutzerimonas zhaodongensis]|uniref:DUF6625 family protein n=1 Tax=Stutzerimonas zhaodongensis TaxID=1176257 RepID=UPI002103BDA9|nr:DUF6625 family protein [Stutzerimonas zhaodongensis]MCQ2028301.1 hypothetical protein [Stutzerimonas zhaodongensis]